MKEVKAAQKKQEQLLDRIETQTALYDDILQFGVGGDTMEKKTVTFQRDALYQEIWEISLSKVAKKYNVPYDKLRAACVKVGIPLPTQSYWGNLQVGKPVQKTPLPESAENELSVEFSYRKKAVELRDLLEETEEKAEEIPLEKAKIEAEKATTPDGRNIYSRETLYREVWEQPVSKVALKYGVSDVMIHKVCNTLNVPVPPRGYWAKLQAGQTVTKTPLPEASDKEKLLGRGMENKLEKQKTVQKTGAATLGFLPEEERTRLIETALALRVDPELKKLHPVLRKHKATFSAWAKQHPRDEYANWKHDSYRSKSKDEPPLWESVSGKTLPRVYRFLDPLYRAVEKLGGKVFDDLSFEIRNERVLLFITEGRDQTPHVLTKDEQRKIEQYEREKLVYRFASEPKFRKYDYIPNGKLRISTYGDGFIRDTDSAGVEGRIGEVLLALYQRSEDERIKREKREEARRKEEEEKRRKELRRQKYDEEVDKLWALVNKANDFETACKIRAYIAAVESKPDLDTGTLEWIAWAKAKADWYDPTENVVDPIFGERDHAADPKDKTPVKKSSYYYW